MNINIFNSRLKASVLALALVCALQTPAAAQSGQSQTQSGQAAPLGRLLTLKECTEYAIENNISLSQSRLDEQDAETDLLAAKAGMLPSVSASTNQGVSGNWFNNSTSHKNSYSGSYGVSANWTLYNGGSVRRNIEQKENTLQMKQLTVEKNTLTLKETIAQYYIQVLYDRENIKMREEAAKVSKAQWERGLEFMKAGSMSKADCAKLESQHTADLYQVTQAKSQYDSDLLKLKSTIRLQRELVDIVIPEVGEERVLEIIPNMESVFEKAKEIRPEVQLGKLSVANSELALASARGAYGPKISLGANTGTNNMSGMNTSFGRQLKTNWSNSASISLSIPIYSQRQNRSAVEKARNNVAYTRLAAQQNEDDMYTKIETLYLNAVNYQQQYLSAKKSFESAKESYRLVNEQFELGMKNIVELEQEKSTYLNAELSLAQAKYMTLYSLQVLKFYTGQEIEI